MMDFFRKYQRYFFIFLTAIIVVSFSFFGTYSSLSQNEVNDPVVFSKIDGKNVHASEFSAWIRFISSDAEDKLIAGGIWGPNFLNDGVIKKDFLESGLASIAASPFFNELKDDLNPKFEKEKRFKPYTHPNVQFLSAESVWSRFAPDIKEKLSAIQNLPPTLNTDLLQAQIDLYLAEKKFPEPYLKKIIAYQEGQYEWIRPDISLQSRDLSLFGNRTIEDWFGPKFIELVAQVVMNGASVAEAQGFKVSEEEALQDLYFNNEMSFRHLQRVNSAQLGVKNSQEYFQQQLRLLGLDQKMAAQIWRQVLLFRHLNNTAKLALVVDPLTVTQFQDYAGKNVEVDLYQMKAPLRLKKEKDLQKLDTYLTLISNRKNPLEIPQNFKSVDEVRQSAPELVQKCYIVRMAYVPQSELVAKVLYRGMLNWELDENSWGRIKLQFPELIKYSGSTREERLDAINSLDPNARAKLDTMAREAIVESNPSWVSGALEEKPVQEMVLKIKEKGSTLPLNGISDVKAFQALLDSGEPLTAWSQNGKDFYNIEVVKCDDKHSLVTFEEANKDKSLDKLLTNRVGKEAKPVDYDKHFAALYDQVIDEASKRNYNWNQNAVSKGDFAAQHYFLSYLEQEKENGTQNASEPGVSTLVGAFEPLLAKNEFDTQFTLQKEILNINRKGNERFTDLNPFFELEEGKFSPVIIAENEGPFFFKINNITKDLEGNEEIFVKVHEVIGKAASQKAMQEMIQEMVDKKAINLSKKQDV